MGYQHHSFLNIFCFYKIKENTDISLKSDKQAMASKCNNIRRLTILIKFKSNIKILKWQKEKKNFFYTFLFFFNFVQITVVQKYYKILVSKHFLQQQQNILIVYFCWFFFGKPLIVCECGVLFLLTFIVMNKLT